MRMDHKVNPETVTRLMEIHKDEPDLLEVIVDALESFEKYHQSVYKLEIRRMLYASGAMSAETYREVIPELDSVRTANHNVLLSEVTLLNRLAKQDGLPLFCEGEISGERPVRTRVADAVLAFVRQVISDRITGGR